MVLGAHSQTWPVITHKHNARTCGSLATLESEVEADAERDDESREEHDVVDHVEGLLRHRAAEVRPTDSRKLKGTGAN